MRTKIFGISPGLYGQPRSYDPIGGESGAKTLISVDTDFFSNILQPSITVTAKDSNGLRFKTGGAEVILTTDIGPDANISAIIDNNDGTYSATLTILNDYAGVVVISGSINSEAIVDTASTETYFSQPDVNTSLLTVNPTSLLSNGTHQTLATVQLKDAYGDNITVGGETVTFQSDGGGSFSGRNPIDNNDGTYEHLYNADDFFVGDVTFTAELDGTPIIDTAVLTQIQPTAHIDGSLIFALPAEIVSDGVTVLPIFLNARDEDGVVVGSGGETVVLLADNGATVGTVTDEGDGNYTADLTTSTEGTITITAILNGELVNHSATVEASLP